MLMRKHPAAPPLSSAIGSKLAGSHAGSTTGGFGRHPSATPNTGASSQHSGKPPATPVQPGAGHRRHTSKPGTSTALVTLTSSQRLALALPVDADGSFCLTTSAILSYVVGPEHQFYLYDLLQHDGMLLELIPRQLLNRTLVERAVSSNGLALKVAPAAFRADKDVVLMAICKDPFALAYAPDSMQDDADLVLEAATQDTAVLQLASQRLSADASFMLQAVALDATALTYASNDLLQSPAFRQAAAEANPLSIHYFVDTPDNPTLIPHTHRDSSQT